MYNSGDLIVKDKAGNPIPGLFRKPDGSFVNRDLVALDRARAQQTAFLALNNEVAALKEQIKMILEKLNG